MKKILALLLVAALGGCGDDDTTTTDAGIDANMGPIGNLGAPLDTSKKLNRSQETLAGNLIADAFLSEAKKIDPTVQIALFNAGSLRCDPAFDAADCVGYVVPTGEFTGATLDIILPFDNPLVIKTVTGAQLKSTLERSVSVLPGQTKGWFVHVSDGSAYAADCALTAQALDVAGTAIVTEGARVTAASLDATAISDTASYKIVVSSYIGSGEDGFVALAPLAATETPLSEQSAVRGYLADHNPATPTIENRITLTAACTPP